MERAENYLLVEGCVLVEAKAVEKILPIRNC